MERLKNMKRSARGNGNQSCILCNESFGLFAFQAHQCHGCRKVRALTFVLTQQTLIFLIFAYIIAYVACLY